MNENMLLKSSLSQELYKLIEDLPIIDWHNHLSVQDIAIDRQFGNLAELWVKSDPYKHRAMRICGIPERVITGDASDYEKYLAWANIYPKLAGNPLYQWSELELKRIFGIDTPLNSETAKEIWNDANAKLQEKSRSACGILRSFKVEYAAPCVSLCDNLDNFSGIMPGIVPSLRGDDIVSCAPTFLAKLGNPTNWESFASTISARLDTLHKLNCRFSDHALDCGFQYAPQDGRQQQRFKALLEGTLTAQEKIALQSEILRLLANEYAKRNWTMQLHIGAQRQTSTRLRNLAGPAGGYAGIGHTCDITSITAMLDEMEQSSCGLPRCILYTLNPADNAALTVLTGSYSQDDVVAKVQAGPAWWFCDHIYGMRQCFENYASFGVLSTFIGMTTDSRSLLSFVRHEYFRRCFCAWLAEKVEAGEMPDDFTILAQIAMNVSYVNSSSYIKD